MLKRYLMQKFIHLLFIFIFMQHTTYFQAVIKMHLVDPAAYCCISLSPVSMVVLLCQVCMFESFSWSNLFVLIVSWFMCLVLSLISFVLKFLLCSHCVSHMFPVLLSSGVCSLPESPLVFCCVLPLCSTLLCSVVHGFQCVLLLPCSVYNFLFSLWVTSNKSWVLCSHFVSRVLHAGLDVGIY